MTTPLTEAQFRALVERFVTEHAADNEKQAAQLIGVSHMQLSEFLAGADWPGLQLAAYFGLVPEVRYVRREQEQGK